MSHPCTWPRPWLCAKPSRCPQIKPSLSARTAASPAAQTFSRTLTSGGSELKARKRVRRRPTKDQVVPVRAQWSSAASGAVDGSGEEGRLQDRSGLAADQQRFDLLATLCQWDDEPRSRKTQLLSHSKSSGKRGRRRSSCFKP